jgi:sigma-B regulation protein RsbU (phosphoserine phosphatase)
MPEMKGSDLLIEIRRLYPWIVTIILTGYSDPEEIMKTVTTGVFTYLLKPWDSDYLRGEIEKAIDIGNLRKEAEERRVMIENELKWAGEMQKTFLRPSLKNVKGIEFKISYKPFGGLHCSGDYYDVIDINNDQYFFVLGDVSGHGIKAAFITGILKAIIYTEYIQATKGSALSPADFLSWLNKRMSFELRKSSDMLITMIAGVIDLKSQTVKYANAGQTHPFLIAGNGVKEFPVSGSCLGFAYDSNYTDRIEKWVPGDTIFMYTDGLTELMYKDKSCRSIDIISILGQTEYGENYHRQILDSALAQANTQSFSDDVTLLSMRML